MKLNISINFPFSRYIYVCFVYFEAIAQVWINLHRQNVFYTVMLWKGSQVPQELGGRRRSHDEKGNQGVGGFRFTNILELFSIYFFLSMTLLYHFFPYFFCTRPLPTTHDPRHLATLVLRMVFKSLETFLNGFNFPTLMRCKVKLL